MLGGLVGDDHAGTRAESASPHAGTVDDDLALDAAVFGVDGGDAAALGAHIGDADAFDDLDAVLLGSAGQRHGEVDRVDATVTWDQEAGEQVVGPCEGEALGNLRGGDLVDVEAEVALEGGDTAVLLEAVVTCRCFDEADRAEAGGEAGLVLQPGVELAAVEP